MEHHHDIVITGAGMVGAALACILGRTGLSIALVEAMEPRPHWPEGSVDLRVSALTAASEQVFTQIGAWTDMMNLGVSPFREMHVWDAMGRGEIHFDCADIGETRLGHIVENRVIQRVLLEHLERHANIHLYCPAELDRLAPAGDHAEIGLADGTVLRARLVVGADGVNSRTRSLAGIGVQGWSYDQKAVVATIATEGPHQETAWQRFLPSGPLAFLPLRDGRCSIVWSTDPAHTDRLLSATDESFMTQLSEAFGHRLGRVLEVGPRAAFPLRLQHAQRYTGTRLALIGDAAHAIHPLAGQGVNLGLLDAAALAEVLLETLDRKRDIGAMAPLRRFERWRKGDNLMMMMAMDGFKRLFGTRAFPVTLVRNIGLTVTNALPIKNTIMQYAMGIKGDLPRLARGVHL